jgi:hypothetical protein
MRGASGDTQSCSAARPCQRGWEGRLQGADGTWRVLCDCSARTGNGLYGRLGSGLAPFPRLASLRLPDPPRSAPTSLAQSCKSPRPPRSVPPARLAPSPRPALLRPRRAASLGDEARGRAGPAGTGTSRSGTRRSGTSLRRGEGSEAARRGRSKAGRGDGARRAGGTELGGRGDLQD